MRVGASVRKLGLLPPHQQAAGWFGSNRLGGAGEEGLREVLGERGGFGSVFCEEVLRVADRAVKVG